MRNRASESLVPIPQRGKKFPPRGGGNAPCQRHKASHRLSVNFPAIVLPGQLLPIESSELGASAPLDAGNIRPSLSSRHSKAPRARNVKFPKLTGEAVRGNVGRP